MKGRVLEASLVSVLLLSGSLGAREVDDEALAHGRGAREFRSTRPRKLWRIRYRA